MIGRAAYLAGAPRAPQTRMDELAAHYGDPADLFGARPQGAPPEPRSRSDAEDLL